jgi:hypothetical protein
MTGTGGALVVGEFLPPLEPGDRVVLLDEREQWLRGRMLACFQSQRELLARLPLGSERFRPAPRTRFDVPPHEGPLHYERCGWPLTGARFRELARAAELELGLDAIAV